MKNVKLRQMIFYSIAICFGLFLSLISVYIFISLLSRYGFLVIIFFLLVTGFGALLSFALYSLYKNKQNLPLSIFFGLLGIALIIGGTIPIMPHTMKESFRDDWSHPWFNELFTLQPYALRIFRRDNLLPLNRTVIQLKISTSRPLIFKMHIVEGISYSEEPLSKALVALNKTLGGFGEVGKHWIIYYWAPYGPDTAVWWDPTHHRYSQHYTLWFVLENQKSPEANVSFEVTEFDFKAIAQKTTTHHQPFFDPSFSYTGITLVSVSIMVNTFCFLKQKKKAKPLS